MPFDTVAIIRPFSEDMDKGPTPNNEASDEPPRVQLRTTRSAEATRDIRADNAPMARPQTSCRGPDGMANAWREGTVSGASAELTLSMERPVLRDGPVIIPL